MTPCSVAPLALAAVLFTGCTISGGDALQSAVDTTIITGSITPPSPAEAARLSDSRTVRNAVSAADVASIDTARPLAWANSETGATGAITQIAEVREGERICRTFTTSRRRFDGIALFGGEACTAGGGEWVMTRFREGG